MHPLSITDLRRSERDDLRLGVVGDPVGHSLSPAMQNAALEFLHLPYRYGKLHVAPRDLPEAFDLFRERDFIGWNLTIPHKIAVLDLLDGLDASAEKLRSVNTVVNQSGRLFGFNTDGSGFLAAFGEAFDADLQSMRTAVLGAGGGAGQTVARALAEVGVASLVLMNRTESKIERLAEELRSGSNCRTEKWDRLAAVCAEVDLLVNASAVGLDGESMLEGWNALEPRHFVFDMIYGPQETPLVRFARQKGARAVDGLLMLLHQGAFAFEIWFGKPAPHDKMRAALWRAAGRA